VGQRSWHGRRLESVSAQDAYYFLPSEDEWYKAAFHKNDGPTANYWDYATGSNTIPTSVISGTSPNTAVYDLRLALGQHPADVGIAGGLSPYGTRGQIGNEHEWTESAYDEVNDSSDEMRAARGGAFNSLEYNLRASDRGSGSPYLTINGFRAASVATPNIPEPSSVLLLLGSAWMGLLERRRRPANRSS
jgi:formylglycine-generating enzyme required for sulfatase activity